MYRLLGTLRHIDLKALQEWAAREQAQTMLHWADKSLLLDSKRETVRALFTDLYGQTAVTSK